MRGDRGRRRAGDSKSLGDALNALGTSLISNGAVEEGVAALREAIATASPGWSYFSGHVNLADALHLVGRSEEALAVALEALRARRAASASRAYEWLALQVVDIEWDLGALAGRRARTCRRTARASARRTRTPSCGSPRSRSPTATTTTPSCRWTARSRSSAARASRSSSAGRARCAPSSSAAAATSPRRATVIDDALDAIEFCSEDRARIARLAQVGAQIEADAAERARDLGDEQGERLAISRAEGYAARIEACADDSRPVEQAQLASASAALMRARGEPDPAAHVAAAETWLSIERPYPAAIERLLEAQVLTARGEREQATVALGAAREQALAIGADWLLSRSTGSRCARGSRPRVRRRRPRRRRAEIEDPFGLTPREQQVLALVASGCTNREIGQHLFMAEKTASVHVSRILSKLDVRSRTEAAAVAHRLGMTASIPRLRNGGAAGRPQPGAAYDHAHESRLPRARDHGLAHGRARRRRRATRCRRGRAPRGKAEQWAAAHGAAAAATPAEAAGGADAVISMVVDGPQVESVLLGEDGAAGGARPGTLFVDMSTIAPVSAVAIAQSLAAGGHRFLDAPVTGSSPAAEAGTLTIMVGGAEADLDSARPLLEAMGRTIVHAGPTGHGQLVKLLNNSVAAANALTAAQALVAGRALGVGLRAARRGAAGRLRWQRRTRPQGAPVSRARLLDAVQDRAHAQGRAPLPRRARTRAGPVPSGRDGR